MKTTPVYQNHQKLVRYVDELKRHLIAMRFDKNIAKTKMVSFFGHTVWLSCNEKI